MCTQAAYLTLVQRYAENNFSTVEILQLNSFNCLPMLAILMLGSPELNKMRSFDLWSDTGFLVMFGLVISLGSLLNYTLFLCTSLNSALTTSLVGSLKSVVQTAIGIFTFEGLVFNLLNIIGIILNMCGGFLYTYVKYKQSPMGKMKTLPSTDSMQLLLPTLKQRNDKPYGLRNGEVHCNIERIFVKAVARVHGHKVDDMSRQRLYSDNNDEGRLVGVGNRR